MKLDKFQIGDRVELVRYFSLRGEPLPQGIVVGISRRCIRAKMDRHGRVIRLAPSDIRIMKGEKRLGRT